MEHLSSWEMQSSIDALMGYGQSAHRSTCQVVLDNGQICGKRAGVSAPTYGGWAELPAYCLEHCP